MLLEFQTILARCHLHADEVINSIVETKGHLFRPAGEAPANHAVTTTPKAPAANGKAEAVCASWLSNGKCTNQECPYRHPDGLANALHGQGQSGGRGDSKRSKQRRRRGRSEQKRALARQPSQKYWQPSLKYCQPSLKYSQPS